MCTWKLLIFVLYVLFSNLSLVHVDCPQCVIDKLQPHSTNIAPFLDLSIAINIDALWLIMLQAIITSVIKLQVLTTNFEMPEILIYIIITDNSHICNGTISSARWPCSIFFSIYKILIKLKQMYCYAEIIMSWYCT